jgi:hypothetical protein
VRLFFKIGTILYFIWPILFFGHFFWIWIAIKRKPYFSNPDPKRFLGYENSMIDIVLYYSYFSFYLGLILLVLGITQFFRSKNKRNNWMLNGLLILALALQYLVTTKNAFGIWEWYCD